MLTIAICEDEPAAALQLKALLSHFCRQRHLDYTVSTFSSGEALLLARPEPDDVFQRETPSPSPGLYQVRKPGNAGYRFSLVPYRPGD